MIRFMLIAVLLIAGAMASAAEPTAYVINTTGETLSKIDITAKTVTNDIVILGSDIDCYPNQIKLRDSLAYVVNSGTDEIQIINLNSETTVGWIVFPTGSNPYWFDFLDDRYIYVTLLIDNLLVKVDLNTGQTVHTTVIGQAPEAVVIYDNRAYVAVTGYDFGSWSWGQGQLAVYDCIGDTIITTIDTPTNPQFLDFDGNGQLHIACTGDYYLTPGAVLVVDLEDFAIIDTIATGGQPGQVAVTPDNMVYVSAGGWGADGELYKYNASSFEIYHDAGAPLYVDSGAFGMAAFADSTVFVGTFADRVFQVGSDDLTRQTYLLGDGPVDIAFNYVAGDANGDWGVNVGDAVYLINYVFKQGSPPKWPAWRGNSNGDGSINVGDAVYLINFIFKSGEAPKSGPLWIR